MGYDISIKVAEIDNEFKSLCKEAPNTKLSYYQLLGYCMTCNNKSSDEIYKELKWRFTYYKSILEEDWKFNLKPDEDGNYNYCGWEYSHNDYNEFDDNDIFEKLYLITITSIDSIHENEHNYWNRSNLIKECLQELEDEVWSYWNHKFVDKYRDNSEESY